MKQLNKFTMTLLSRSSNESFSRVAVTAFIAQLDPTLEEINDIKTAVSEAVTNCIVHAYKNEIGNIYISVRILEGNVVEIKIRDKGCGIANLEQAMTPLYSSEGGERAGLGFTVMQSFMDALRVSSREGKGTTVIMKKRISVRMGKNA
jgi:stage II sporulation protein AB (anti-sigma F factor)